MPELPDVTVYVEHAERRLVGRMLRGIRIASPNLLRTFDPPVGAARDREVVGVRRMGKRIVLSLAGDLHLAIHLMVSGRLHWKEPGAALPKRTGLAAFDFEHGSLTLTESSTRQRAGLHVLGGEHALSALDPGGVDPIEGRLEDIARALAHENHTLKRSLCDPRLFSGIGNAYSDEILHAAKLSPLRLTSQLEEAEVRRLVVAMRAVLLAWTDRLRAEAGEDFPEQVTAFRDGMAVHGRFGKPCPACGSPVQRIVYAEHETNYCATCQTGGRLLADRALSRLLREDWPRTLEDLEERREG